VRRTTSLRERQTRRPLHPFRPRSPSRRGSRSRLARSRRQ
jgi:hypothetical protein